MRQKPTTRAADPERSRERAEERHRHDRHGAHVRSALGDRAVLHQREEQRLPQLPRADAAGLRLRGVRQGGRRAWTSSTGSPSRRPATPASIRTSRGSRSSSSRRPSFRRSERSPMVKLHTNFGVITLELDEARAPESVKNFLGYVESGHYDEHRVPPRHRRLHDPGRRVRAGHEAEADPGAGQERGAQRPQERRATRSRWRARPIRTPRPRSSSST